MGVTTNLSLTILVPMMTGNGTTARKSVTGRGSKAAGRDAEVLTQAKTARRPEALEAYESSLEVWPGRYRSLLGAARAAAAADRPEAATRYYAQLLDTVGDPAEPRPGIVEARRSVSGGAEAGGRGR